jgi:hypothetical protein
MRSSVPLWLWVIGAGGLAVLVYYILATAAGDPLGVQRKAAAALNTGLNAEARPGQPVSIIDNPDPISALGQWIAEVTTNTGLRW